MVERIEQYYQGVCVLILGVCGHGGPSEFFINDDLTLRPRSGNRRYNASYSSVSNAHTFCFINIIEDTILTEYCYQSHIAQCVLCSASTGEVYFLSRSDIYKSIQCKPESVKSYMYDMHVIINNIITPLLLPIQWAWTSDTTYAIDR